MSEPMIFTSKRSFIDQYVRPALGAEADNFDVEAIADAMLEHHAPPRGMDPAWRDGNRLGFVEKQGVSFWEIVERNEITPDAGQGNEGDEQILKHSSATTAYLLDRGNSTGVTYATWSGKHLDMDGHMLLVVPVEAVQRIHAAGQGLVSINPDCVAAQSAAVRARREAKANERRRQVRARIRSHIAEQYDAEYIELENRMAAIERKIDEKVEHVLATEAEEDDQ